MILTTQSGELRFRGFTNGHPVEVRDTGHLRLLHFGGQCLQSVMDISNPNRLILPYTTAIADGIKILTPCFKSIYESPTPPQKILVLGLGGGSLMRYIQAEFPLASLNVIEIDPLVVAVCHEFFHLEHSKNLNLLIDDGSQAIKKYTSMDLIISDIYGSDETPELLLSSSFYENVYHALSHTGTFILNLVVDSHPMLLQVLNIIRPLFDNHTLLLSFSHYRNRLIFASKNQHFKKILSSAIEKNQLKSPTYDFTLGHIVNGFF